MTGTLLGVVRDPARATVPAAVIRVTNERTGAVRVSASGETGGFEIPFLEPGSYEVRIERPGFQTYLERGVEVRTGSTVRLEAELKLGDVAETVEVQGAASLLQTDRADLARTLNQRSLVNLPLPTRNYMELISLQPGVTPPSSISSTLQNPMEGRAFQANGQLRSSNNSQVDGVDNNDPLIGVTINMPPIESIEEVNIASGNFSADQGRAGGAVVNVVTRGGANELHGSLFAFNQVAALRARNLFNVDTQPKPGFRRNQYGATAGGAVRRDRTFWFGSYQGLEQERSTTQTTTVPVEAWRSGIFTDTPGLNLFDPATGTPTGTGRQPFPNQVIPASRVHPVAVNIQRELVATNLDGLTGNYITNVPSTLSGRQGGGRLDHRFSERTFGFLKYDHSRFTVEDNAALGREIGEGALSNVATHTAIANLTRSWTAGLYSETRLGYNRYRSNVTGINADRPLSREFGIANPNPDFLSESGLARIAINTMQGIGMPFIYPIINTDNIFTVVSNWTLTRQRHTLKWGGEVRRLRLDRFQATGLNLGPRGLFNFNPGVTQLRGGPALGPFGAFGNAYAGFLLGAPDQSSRTYLTVTPTNRQTHLFGFVNDSWRVNSRLTLDFGLRYELYTPVVPRYPGGAANYDPTRNALLVAGIGEVGMSTGVLTDANNFAPRFGFAFRPTGRTVIRGGYGISYFTGINGYTGGTLSTQFPVVGNVQIGATNDFVVDGTLSAIPAVPVIPIPGNGVIENAPNQAFFHIPFDNRYPYVQSFNLTVQRDLGGGFVADVGYVGTIGRKLPIQTNLNAAPPGSGRDGQPLFARFGRLATTNARRYGANNNYHSLQASLSRQFARGFLIQSSYTYGKAMEDAVVVVHTDRRRNYGPASYDRQQMFNLAHVWDLPFGKGQRLLNSGFPAMLAGGWQLNGIFRAVSGLPVTIIANATPCNCPGNGNFADALRPAEILGGRGRNQLWFDSGAFAIPGPNRFGNAGAGTVRGPGFVNYDMSLFRRIPLRERASLEFRAEAFNLSNTPRFADPDRNVNSGNFGQILGTLDNAGERQIQFALRLTF